MGKNVIFCAKNKERSYPFKATLVCLDEIRNWLDDLGMAVSHIALWVYIVLLIGGGLVGYLKAGSRVSLITSLAFGILLTLVNIGVIRSFYVADVLVALLIAVFIMRYLKTKKFMPSGLMIVLSAAALGLMLLST